MFMSCYVKLEPENKEQFTELEFIIDNSVKFQLAFRDAFGLVNGC